MGSGVFYEVWPLATSNSQIESRTRAPHREQKNNGTDATALLLLDELYGFATLCESAMLRRQVRQATGKPRGHRSPRKIDVTRKLTVVSVSVVTLIRTDTTLDHSQKAEKV